MVNHVDYLSTYGHPERVLADDRLDATAKREILEEWRLDAQRRQTSASEGLEGGKDSMLAAVDKALLSLET